MPTRIGRYVDLELLGQGGMGAVYRARDPELDRMVAIKVMLDATPDFVARFRREAQAIARLTHPNVVQVFDFGVDDEGNPYFVMELIDGTPLDKIVRERGAMQPVEAVRLIKQAADGLAAAHRAGIIHRDVKPSNLIVDGRGNVKLVDFGISRVTGGQALTSAAALMGTPGYMAPEQAQGKPVDHRADIYALGLTLWELLAGHAPYAAPDALSLVVKAMQEPLPDLRLDNKALPEELVQLVEKMGAKDPDERMQTCEAVATALDDVFTRLKTGKMEPALAPTDQIPKTFVHAKEPSTAPKKRKSSKHLPIIGVGVLVLGGAGIVVLARSHDGKLTVKAGDTSVGIEVHNDPAPKPKIVEKQVPPPPRTGPLRVAVLKFKNVGADAALALLEQGIGETALNSLAGTKDVTLIERNDIDSDIGEIDRGGDVHFDALSVAQKGKLEGVEVAVQGGFQKAAGKLRITARFVRVETGEVLDTLTVTRGAKDPFKAQDEVAQGLKDKLLALAAKERK